MDGLLIGQHIGLGLGHRENLDLQVPLDRGVGVGESGFQLGLDGQLLGRHPIGELRGLLEVLLEVPDGSSVLSLVFTGNCRRGDDATALGRGHQILGPLLDRRLPFGARHRLLAAQRVGILAALRGEQHIDHGPDEHERRGEDVDADAGDMGRGVVAHQLDPEPPDGVARDIQGEQSAVTEPEPAVRPDQHDEHQQVPQQFVEEGGVDDGRHLPGRHTVEGVHVDHSGPVPAVEDLHAPRHGGLPAVQLLVEIVAQPADRLRQHDPGGDGVTEGGQGNTLAAARDPRTDTAECDGAPDAQAALPYPQGGSHPGAAGPEVRLPVGHQVVDTPTDQAERDRPECDVVDDSALAAAGGPAAVTDDQCGDDAGDDAQRIGPDRERAEIPDALSRTREVGKHGCGHVAGTFSRTPTASSPVRLRTAATPSSVNADTRAEPTMTPSA